MDIWKVTENSYLLLCIYPKNINAFLCSSWQDTISSYTDWLEVGHCMYSFCVNYMNREN